MFIFGLILYSILSSSSTLVKYRVLYGESYELTEASIDSGIAYDLTFTEGVDSFDSSDICINEDCTSPQTSFLHNSLIVSSCFYDAPVLLCAILDSGDVRLLHFQRVQEVLNGGNIFTMNEGQILGLQNLAEPIFTTATGEAIICDSNLSQEEARLICDSGAHTYSENSIEYGGSPSSRSGSVEYWKNFQCDDSAAWPGECSYDKDATPCTSGDVVKLRCLHNSQDKNMRLLWQGSDTDTKPSGKLEVFHRGSWNTVCNDHFGFFEAHLTCKYLGRDWAVEVSSILNSLDYTKYYQTGDIVLSNLHCTGSEYWPGVCSHNGWGASCSTGKDVWLTCGAADVSNLRALCSQPSAMYCRAFCEGSTSDFCQKCQVLFAHCPGIINSVDCTRYNNDDTECIEDNSCEFNFNTKECSDPFGNLCSSEQFSAIISDCERSLTTQDISLIESETERYDIQWEENCFKTDDHQTEIECYCGSCNPIQHQYSPAVYAPIWEQFHCSPNNQGYPADICSLQKHRINQCSQMGSVVTNQADLTTDLAQHCWESSLKNNLALLSCSCLEPGMPISSQKEFCELRNLYDSCGACKSYAYEDWTGLSCPRTFVWDRCSNCVRGNKFYCLDSWECVESSSECSSDSIRIVGAEQKGSCPTVGVKETGSFEILSDSEDSNSITLTANDNEVLIITIANLNLEEDYDFLHVYDGSTASDSKLIARLTGSHTDVTNFESISQFKIQYDEIHIQSYTSNQMLFVLSTDETVFLDGFRGSFEVAYACYDATGFQAKFAGISESCYGTLNSNDCPVNPGDSCADLVNSLANDYGDAGSCLFEVNSDPSEFEKLRKIQCCHFNRHCQLRTSNPTEIISVETWWSLQGSGEYINYNPDHSFDRNLLGPSDVISSNYAIGGEIYSGTCSFESFLDGKTIPELAALWGGIPTDGYFVKSRILSPHEEGKKSHSESTVAVSTLTFHCRRWDGDVPTQTPTSHPTDSPTDSPTEPEALGATFGYFDFENMHPGEYTDLWISTFKKMLWVCQYDLDDDFIGIDDITFLTFKDIGNDNMNATRIFFTYDTYRWSQSLTILSATKVAILDGCLHPYVERGFPGVYFQGIIEAVQMGDMDLPTLQQAPVEWSATQPNDLMMAGKVTLVGLNRPFDLQEQFNFQVGIVNSLRGVHPPITPGSDVILLDCWVSEDDSNAIEVEVLILAERSAVADNYEDIVMRLEQALVSTSASEDVDLIRNIKSFIPGLTDATTTNPWQETRRSTYQRYRKDQKGQCTTPS